MINHVRSTVNALRRATLASLAALLIICGPTPVYVFADDCSPVATAPTGIQAPTGSAASTYTYNSCTGLWENPHYTWDPSTKVTTPKDTPLYTYNNATGKWDVQTWEYSPAQKSWYQATTSVSTPPAGAQTSGGPVAVTPTTAPTQTGNSSTTSQTVNGTANTTVNDTTNASVNNTITGTSTSGAASVLGNNNGGSALSGNAQTVANVINMLQSSSSLGSTAATFTANIDGNVQGDLILDPSALQPSANATSIGDAANTKINVANNGQINNNLTLDSTSGDATVANNTNGGNATSGSAQAVANVVNMMNSLIAANQSFLGVININGNLNGNILMPQSFLDNLIASNAPQETVSLSQDALNSVSANLTNSTGINNNIKSTAASGNANVSGNTNAGTAKTGDASTNVTIFNVANEQITGGNTMLVFVNVVGKWVGVIMDAPAGATAAELGGGITNSAITNAADITASNNGIITNNLNLNSQSGDATVTGNTHGGNAASGSANNLANISNISNSSLNLSGWFGILFINVFGNWTGNFGVVTPAATNAAATAAGTTTPQAFGFIPHAAATSMPTTSYNYIGNGSSNASQSFADGDIASVAAKVLADTTGASGAASHKSTTTAAADKNQALFIGAGLFLVGVILMVLDKVRSRHNLVR